MRIALAQIEPIKEELSFNLKTHINFTLEAKKQGADLILFPELSLTAYEPELAALYAMDIEDEFLLPFRALAVEHQITIGLGLPSPGPKGIYISLCFFRPEHETIAYHKQMLHEDELPFFMKGKQQLILEIGGYKIAPAICYEALQHKHAWNAARLGADIYLASVAKPSAGIERAYAHMPQIAKEFNMIVGMVNNIGPTDTFMAAGKTAWWDSKGQLKNALGETETGLLLMDLA